MGATSPLPKRIVVHGNCVDCGQPLAASPVPFAEKSNKPLAPGNTRLQMEMPDEAQHKSPERCEKCKLGHYQKWQSRRKQLPWLVALAVVLVVLVGWMVFRS